MAIYVDTSALCKRYLNEATSPAFDTFMAETPEALLIGPLTITEFESVLQRRLRLQELDAERVEQVRGLLARDLSFAVWQMHPFDPATFDEATRLLREAAPLAALDAMHLASAMLLGCSSLATADKQLGRAALSQGLALHDFSS